MPRYSPSQAYWYRRHRMGRGTGVNAANGGREWWHQLLQDESEGVSFGFKNGEVLIRSDLEPAKRYRGSPQQAVDAGIISFTRATTKMVVGADRLLTQIASGVIPITHDPVTGECLGYLPEPARTNLLTYSAEFDNAAWAKGTAVTVSANADVAPDGATIGDRLIEAATTAAHQMTGGVTVVNATAYTFSIYAKAGTAARYLGLRLSSGAYFSGEAAIADLALGTVTGTGSSIRDCGNGWYRVSITATAKASGTAAAGLNIAITNSSSSISSYLGDGASYIRIFGAQIELGAYPTSYIPTTSAAVPRNADVMTVALSKLPFSASAGTMIGVFQGVTYGLFTRAAQIDDATNANRIFIAQTNQQYRGRLVAEVSSVQQAAIGASAGSDVRMRVAGAWATDDFQLVTNGAAETADISGTVPTGLTTLRFGSDISAANNHAAPIESLVYIPRRLNQAEMIARTA